MAKKITVFTKKVYDDPITLEAGENQEVDFMFYGNGNWIEIFLCQPNHQRKTFFLIPRDEILSVEVEN